MRGKSWRLAVIGAVFLCGQRGAPGQQIHLKSGDVYTGAVEARAGRPEARLRPHRLTRGHQVIQFDHLPGVADLQALLSAGFRIVAAIPDNAVVVIAPDTRIAPTAGVRWSGELEDSDKLSPLFSGASSPDSILAIVEFHSDVETNVQQSIASAEGVELARPAALLSNHAIVSASIDRLRALASHDEVAYIFPADPSLSAGDDLMPCAGMLTLAGPIAQYANIVHGWDLDSDHAAHLGYIFGALTAKVPASTIQSEILRAMNAWSAIANVIFEPASSATASKTVLVKFASGSHGDSWPFDGPGGMLAHTFYPVPLNSESIAGDIHLDADENWHAGGDIDIYSVALHELGHAIGLGHSDKPGDVMYPYYRRGMQLSSNDTGAAQALYGARGTLPGSAGPITAVQAPVTAPLSLTFNPITPNPISSSASTVQTAISGIVSGGVPPLALQYQTDHGYSGTVTAGNSGAWSASGVTLATGSNTVTVTAFDSAHHTVSQSAVVVRTAVAPTTTAPGPLSVLITSPASSVTTAKAATISLGGTSSGGTGITQVTWQTSTGATGTATGTDHWLASNVPLLTGTNTIVVRAFDGRGMSAWAAVVAVRP